MYVPVCARGEVVVVVYVDWAPITNVIVVTKSLPILLHPDGRIQSIDKCTCFSRNHPQSDVRIYVRVRQLMTYAVIITMQTGQLRAKGSCPYVAHCTTALYSESNTHMHVFDAVAFVQPAAIENPNNVCMCMRTGDIFHVHQTITAHDTMCFRSQIT